MLGHSLMVFLVCFYAVVACVFVYEGNYPKALYWVGACTITYSVLWMS